MKMFLTRLTARTAGWRHRRSEPDRPAARRQVGLNDAIETIKGVPGVTVTEFTDVDVVRHPLVTRIVARYNAKDPRLIRPKPAEGER